MKPKENPVKWKLKRKKTKWAFKIKQEVTKKL